MIEAYCTEEVVECCQDYLVDNKGIGLVASRHSGSLEGKGTRGRKTFIDSAYTTTYYLFYDEIILSPIVENPSQFSVRDGFKFRC